MRQAILRERGRIELVTQPIPTPGKGEVLLRVRAALTCGTDLKTYRRGHPKLPFGPFGHECAGDVVAVGAGVRHMHEGDAVIPMPTAPCGQCDACRRGREHLCDRQFDDIVLGAYADYLLVSAKVAASQLVRKTGSLSYIEAAFLEPLSCVVHAWAKLRASRPAQVAIVGLGTIGLLHLAVAKARGVRVLAVGRRQERLALASRLGAEVVLDADREGVGDALRMAAGGTGPDVVIECTGIPAMWEQVPQWTARGGRVVLFGGLPTGTRVSFDATRLHYDEVDVLNSFHFRRDDIDEALRLLAGGEVNVRPIITDVKPLSSIVEVFAALDGGSGIKYAILPEGTSWT